MTDQTSADASSASNAMLWAPSEERIAATRLWSFMQQVNAEYGTELDSYDAAYDWSGDLRITQTVNREKGVHMMMAKSHLS